MAGSKPWYLDFSAWRIRRSELETVKLLLPQTADLAPVFWEIRGFCKALGFRGRTWILCNWWRKSEEQHANHALVSLGLGVEEHIRLSKKQLEGRHASLEAIARAPLEMQVSSKALLVLLARWSSIGSSDRRIAAQAMLHDVLSLVLATRAGTIRQALGPPRGAMHVQCGRPAARGGEHCKHITDLVKKKGDVRHYTVAAMQWAMQADLLVELFESYEKCAQARLWLENIIGIIASALGEELLSGRVGKQSPEHLSHLRGGKRSLRLDPEYRRLAVVDVVQAKRFRNAQGMARAGNIPLAETTARMLSTSYGADMVWSTYKELHTAKHLHIASDGTTIDGEETLTFAWWTPQQSHAGWLVPQVHMQPARSMTAHVSL